MVEPSRYRGDLSVGWSVGGHDGPGLLGSIDGAIPPPPGGILAPSYETY